MASPVTLLFKRTNVLIGAVQLDASVSELHTAENEITEHPIEAGSSISDHKRRKPDMLQIEGLVSNTPIPAPNDPLVDRTAESEAGAASFSSRSNLAPTRAGTAYRDLLKLADDTTLLTVVTSIRSYDNMAIKSLTVPRDARMGQVLRFTATLTEIKIVQSQTVNVTPKANAKISLGKKAAVPTPAAAQRQSTLHSLGQTTAGQAVKAKFLTAIGVP